MCRKRVNRSDISRGVKRPPGLSPESYKSDNYDSHTNRPGRPRHGDIRSGPIRVSRAGRIGDDGAECSRHILAPAGQSLVAVEHHIVASNRQPVSTRGAEAASWPEGLVQIEAGLSDRRGDAVQRCGCPGGAVAITKREQTKPQMH